MRVNRWRCRATRPVQPVRAGTMRRHGGRDPPSAAQERAAARRLLPVLVGRGGRVRGRRGRRAPARGADERDGRRALRAGVGARRLRRDARASSRTPRGERVAARGFTRRYRQAADTATGVSVRAGPAGAPATTASSTCRSRCAPASFGTIRGDAARCRCATEDDGPRIAWAQRPRRSPACARREAAAQHEPARRAPTCSPATARRWPRARRGPRSLASATRDRRRARADPAERASELRRAGVPEDAQVGITGWSASSTTSSAGTPGGVLRAGGRDAARRHRASARRPCARRSRPSVQTRRGRRARPAASAASRRCGRAPARSSPSPGIAFSGLQPPGSTFKIITLAAALEAKVARPELDASRCRPPRRSTASSCRTPTASPAAASLANTFAHSCNSVFAPLGVSWAPTSSSRWPSSFGFNRAPGIPGAATSTIPPATRSATTSPSARPAIGQGRVQATALQMALVASTIGLRGRRPRLSLDGEPGRPAIATASCASRPRARSREMMLAVVARWHRHGGGDRRRARRRQDRHRRAQEHAAAQCDDAAGAAPSPQPARRRARRTTRPTPTPGSRPSRPPVYPRVAVGVLVVGAGAGGDTAAPIAKSVLEAGLKSGR